MKIPKKILISFLNSILNLKGVNSIKEVEFEEKHLDVSLITSENLSELGNLPQNLIDLINEQDNINLLKSWNKITASAGSLESFREKIK